MNRFPRLAWRLPGLARRSRRLAATLTGGPPLQVAVYYQGRRYQAQVYHPVPAAGGAARTSTSPPPWPISALASWPGASTGSAGSGPTAWQAAPGGHRANPAARPSRGPVRRRRRRWEQFEVPWEHAQALLGHGRCLLALGQAAGAGQPLHRARQILATLGAGPARNDTDQLLAQTTSASA